MEVHWTTGSKKGAKELLLCGGAANHSGCKTSDRTFHQVWRKFVIGFPNPIIEVKSCSFI
ncbi:hypothetical protein LEP1GSC051_2165 [Leptospira sp. P2653]|nr:hypothetical protein LEP1GSC051_2165 [Leptospira sp. P2653]